MQRKRAGIALCAVLGLSMGSAAAQGLESGIYEQLLLAVTADHQVKGFYQEDMGTGVTRSCAFVFTGSISAPDRPAGIISWSSSSLPGTVNADSDGLVLTIPHGQQHDGCVNVMTPDIDTGLTLTKTEAEHWVDLVRISGDKAPLLTSPDAAAKHHGYVVKDNVVAVSAYRDGWAEVVYTAPDGRHFTGWIAKNQYQALQAPKS